LPYFCHLFHVHAQLCKLCVMAVSTFPPFFKRVSFKRIFSLYIQHEML
jgi:hypothetical protein